MVQPSKGQPDHDVTLSGPAVASFEGAVGLSVAAGGLADAAGNVLTEPAPTGADEVYTLDNGAPSVVSITRAAPAAALTNADCLVFAVTFSEEVTGLSAADFTVNCGAGAIIGLSANAGLSVQVTLGGADLAGLDGDVGLDIAAAPQASDPSGNTLATREPGVDERLTLDNTAPTLTLGAPRTVHVGSGSVAIPVTLEASEALAGLDLSALSVTGGTASGLTGGGSSFARHRDRDRGWPRHHRRARRGAGEPGGERHAGGG